MYTLVATLALIGYIHAVPIEIYTGPTRANAILNPECTNDLCQKLEGFPGKAVKIPDGHYLYPSFDPNYEGRCFYSCSGGTASCQCCNDDKLGEVFYHEKCNRCVGPNERNMTVCPTTQPSTIPDPCGQTEDKDYPNKFCRNLASILGSEYQDMDGDFPYKVVADLKPAAPYTKEEFLELAGFNNLYITCVAGMVGWCRPCNYWRDRNNKIQSLKWKPLYEKDGVTPKLQCGRCDY